MPLSKRKQRDTILDKLLKFKNKRLGGIQVLFRVELCLVLNLNSAQLVAGVNEAIA